MAPALVERVSFEDVPHDLKGRPFTAPPHYSEVRRDHLLDSSAIEPSQELKEKPFTAPAHPAETQTQPHAQSPLLSSGDPHTLPTFGSTTLTAPTAPVLYLPPLLSKLPRTLPPVPPADPARAPLSTDTHLPDIDPASLSLHRALHRFHPLSTEYAVTPYAKAFNWGALELPEEEERDWYIVAFRSKRKAGSDGGPLYDADKRAHEEAVQNGGLILYWYGIPNPSTGMNLATCIWQSRKHAIAANARPHHLQAMKLAAASFEMYELERHTLRKVRGERGVRVVPFDGGEVGW